jgi:hypothetical protein
MFNFLGNYIPDAQIAATSHVLALAGLAGRPTAICSESGHVQQLASCKANVEVMDMFQGFFSSQSEGGAGRTNRN